MKHIGIEQQIKIITGVKILIFLLLAQFLYPGFIYIVYIIGAFLIVSGLTGICPAAAFLKKLPYNKKKKGFFGL
ncbi:DUF2892 domain-containing protein [Candidatus Gracilibacteria bacterium]|nr:DUF2892 domain-containing protein [Candidatus Gracilibacteria bacterium]